jgi:hypothetical protein
MSVSRIPAWTASLCCLILVVLAGYFLPITLIRSVGFSQRSVSVPFSEGGAAQRTVEAHADPSPLGKPVLPQVLGGTSVPSNRSRSYIISARPDETLSHRWRPPLFLHESFPHAMDPRHGDALDQSCSLMPPAGTCIMFNSTTDVAPLADPPNGENVTRCLFWFYRASHQACAFATLLDRGKEGLCPCRLKRVALVHNVHFAAELTSDGSIRHKHFFALAESSWNGTAAVPLDAVHQKDIGNAMGSSVHWGLVDATTPEFHCLPCHFGGKWALAKMRRGNAVVQALTAKVQQMRAATVEPSRVPGRAAPHAKEATRSPYTCEALRQNPLAVKQTESLPRLDGVPTVATAVFYALESGIAFPGHSAALLSTAIGQYVHGGLDVLAVPWLVPCVPSGATVKVPVWTRFFLEINEALRFPIYPLHLHEDITTIRPGTSDVIRFASVHFVNYYAEWNQVCFKPALLHKLWPWVLNEAPRQLWNEKLIASVSLDAQILLNSNGTTFPKRIALMKIAGSAGSPFASPDRAYVFNYGFQQMLRDHGIMVMEPTTHLLERMWHINTAEFIVTTWGSAMATTTSWMIPRRYNNNTSSSSVIDGGQLPQRLLVLVHPSYCHEAVFVLRVPLKICAKMRRSPSRNFHNVLSFKASAPTDFVGGPLFCAKYVMVRSLRFVQERDVTFPCPPLAS